MYVNVDDRCPAGELPGCVWAWSDSGRLTVDLVVVAAMSLFAVVFVI
jgi:hypothetical protein